MPIYPSLSVLGSNYEALAGDYDESTIITAYGGDTDKDGSFISANGMIRTDFDTSTQIAKVVKEEKWEENTERAKSHVVQAGDTLSKIASRYGISVETVMWANDMSAGDTLSPGSTLRIPPVSGVVHTVASWDTISEIARFYSVDADDIVRINWLRDAASIRKGMDLMIPGAARKLVDTKKTDTQKTAWTGIKPIPTAEPSSRPTTVDVATGLQSRYPVKYTGLSRGFAWGNCTWYVAQNKSVSWRGNANAWMKNAKAAWVKTGQKPIPGAIIQFSGRGYNRYYGHVGIVADVTDDYVIVKDMNYRKINEVTIRKVPIGDDSIDGYIYAY